MDRRISRTQSVVRTTCTVFVTAILVACSTAQPLGQRGNIEAASIQKAGFRLKSAKVVWVDNPSIPIKASFANFRYAPAVDASRMNRAKEGVSKIMKVMREHAPAQLASELQKAGVAEGNGHTITLTPVGAYRDESGWGSGAIIRVSVSADTKQTLWSAEMDANSGWQWFGPDAIPADDTYAKNLAKGTTDVFKKAGLIQ